MNRIPLYIRSGIYVPPAGPSGFGQYIESKRYIPPAGLSQVALEATAKRIADRIVKAMLPQLTPIVAEAAKAAEPTIRTVIREEVLPKLAVYGGIGLLGVAAVSALVASFVATRRR